MARSKPLERGDFAPGFILPDQSGTEHHLSDYLGHWVVVYFYPRDNTPQCTREACGFRDEILEFRDMDVVVLGISLDHWRRHETFAKKHFIPFHLLSDQGGEVSREYGVLTQFGPLRYARRHTFIIDPDGRIAKVYQKVKAKEHGLEVVADIRALRVAE